MQRMGFDLVAVLQGQFADRADNRRNRWLSSASPTACGNNSRTIGNARPTCLAPVADQQFQRPSASVFVYSPFAPAGRSIGKQLQAAQCLVLLPSACDPILVGVLNYWSDRRSPKSPTRPCPGHVPLRPPTRGA